MTKPKLIGDKLKIAKLKEKIIYQKERADRYEKLYREERNKKEILEREKENDKMCGIVARDTYNNAQDREIKFLKHIVRVYAKDPTLGAAQKILTGFKNGEIDLCTLNKINELDNF